MKKTLAVCLKKLLPLVCMAGMLSGCAAMIGNMIGAAIAPVITAPFEMAGDAAKVAGDKKRTDKESSANPLDSPVEDRLTRRMSTLDGGIPVDVSPYLLHDYSFIVTEEGTRRGESILKSTNTRGTFFEYDTVLTFKADKQDYEMNVTTAGAGGIDDRRKRHLKEFAAGLFGLEPNQIQSFKVQALKWRWIERWFRIDNVFVQVTEPCYFQFDVEVEYQKMKIKEGAEPSAHFDVFNKVYRSDYTTMAGAALDVQMQIWQDARELQEGTKGLFGKPFETPLPIINVVRAEKFTQ